MLHNSVEGIRIINLRLNAGVVEDMGKRPKQQYTGFIFTIIFV